MIVFMLSCNSNPTTTTITDGTFKGIFTVNYENGETVSNPVSITFSDGNYTCSSGPNRIPAGGSGTYKITDGVVTFNDENFWTADFDWGLILDGDYQLESKDGSIILSKEKKSSEAIYQYKIEKK